jgi:RHS repeat-associated protein
LIYSHGKGLLLHPALPYQPLLSQTLFIVALNLRFPGQYFDQESGLAYNHHRDYAPTLGRYVQSDPIGLAGGINTYAYSYSSPLMYVDPNGLFGMADMPTLPQGVVDFGAGLGDALLLGTGGYLRDLAGVDGGVDPCSDAYKYGGWSSFALGAGRLAYAGIAKGGAMLAASGAEASAFRQGLKGAFRFGAAKNWRPPDLSKYPTDAALRAAAGRTNPGMNAYGAGVAAAGAAGAMCGCPQ